MDYGSLDNDLIQTAVDLAKLADRRPSHPDWGVTLTWELGKIVEQLEATAEHDTIRRLKWLVTLMIDGAQSNQTKVSRLHEVLNDINPEHPRNAADAERIRHLQDMADSAQSARDEFILRNALHHWRIQLRERIEQDECAVRVIQMKRAWKAWVRILHERELKKRYVSIWRLKVRYKMAIEDQQKALLKDTLQKWLEATHHKKNMRVAESHYQLKMKSTALAQWTIKAQHSSQLSRTAENFRQAKLKQRAMDHIADQIEHIKLLNRRAQSVEFYRLSTRSLNLLRTKARKKIETRIEDARKAELINRYDEYCQNKQIALASSYLAYWRSKSQVETGKRIAREQELDSKAIEFRQKRLFKQFINALVAHRRRAQTLNNQAEQHYHDRLVVISRDALSKMALIGFHRRWRSENYENLAVNYRQKVTDRMLAAILNHWRDKASHSHDTSPPQYPHTPSAMRRFLLATPAARNTGTPRTVSNQPSTDQTPARKLVTAFRSVAQTAPVARSVTFNNNGRNMPVRTLQLGNDGRSSRSNEVVFEDITSGENEGFEGSIDHIDLDQVQEDTAA